MPNNSKQEKIKAFGRLLDIMDRLRKECPWDRKQTFDTIRPLTIEEAYELSEAILEKDFEKIKKELGDLLLHVVFYAKMGDEQQYFDIKDIIDALCDKLIYRHPHVFGEIKIDDPNKVKENWEKLKLKEKGGNKTVLGGIPSSLPPVIKAYRIQEKVSNVGFDWENKQDVWEKVNEEINEAITEAKNENTDKLEEEIGDALFALINAARLYGIDPEKALEKTNKKFIERFNFVEKNIMKHKGGFQQATLNDMEEYWNKAKKSNNEALHGSAD